MIFVIIKLGIAALSVLTVIENLNVMSYNQKAVCEKNVYYKTQQNKFCYTEGR